MATPLVPLYFQLFQIWRPLICGAQSGIQCFKPFKFKDLMGSITLNLYRFQSIKNKTGYQTEFNRIFFLTNYSSYSIISTIRIIYTQCGKHG
jgi:hypothetical protein